MNSYDLQRFLTAQEKDYETALSEIRQGRKRSHWIWYIFPQVAGLGFSSTSEFYAISDIGEAAAYLEHAVLGKRLVEISQALLTLDTNDANKVFGSPDDLKLRSSMTLFSQLPEANPVFLQVLEKFFKGIPDNRTLEILKQQNAG